MRHKSLMAGLLALSAGFVAHADTLTLASYGSTAAAPAGVMNSAVAYNGSAATYDISPNGVWAGPLGNSSWVSLDPGTSPGGTVVEASGTYSYTVTFMDTAASSGTISVLADDTTSIYLNNNLITVAGTGAAAHCTATGPNCVAPMSFILPGSDFIAGMNTLTFGVEQLYGSATGLDFDGSVTTSSVTPEPSSFALLGTGLLGIAGLMKKRLA